MNLFALSVLTPDGVVYTGPVWQVSALNARGGFAIRYGHARFLSAIEPGRFEIGLTPDNRIGFTCSGGLLQFAENKCIVSCEKMQRTAAPEHRP